MQRDASCRGTTSRTKFMPGGTIYRYRLWYKPSRSVPSHFNWLTWVLVPRTVCSHTLATRVPVLTGSNSSLCTKNGERQNREETKRTLPDSGSLARLCGPEAARLVWRVACTMFDRVKDTILTHITGAPSASLLEIALTSKLMCACKGSKGYSGKTDEVTGQPVEYAVPSLFDPSKHKKYHAKYYFQKETTRPIEDADRTDNCRKAYNDFLEGLEQINNQVAFPALLFLVSLFFLGFLFSCDCNHEAAASGR
eukprot:2514883-Rhodomonas_salina.1